MYSGNMFEFMFTKTGFGWNGGINIPYSSMMSNHTLLGAPVPVSQQIHQALRHQRQDFMQTLSAVEANFENQLREHMTTHSDVQWAFLFGMWSALVVSVLCLIAYRVCKRRRRKTKY